MSEIIFRRLLLLYVIVTFAAVGAAFVPGGYSEALAETYAQEPESWLFRNIWLALAVGLPLLAAVIAGVIGLFLLKRWGRTVSFYSTVISLCLYVFSGPELYSGLESALFEVSSILWGAVLALAYSSPIADRLGANNSFKPKPLRGSA